MLNYFIIKFLILYLHKNKNLIIMKKYILVFILFIISVSCYSQIHFDYRDNKMIVPVTIGNYNFSAILDSGSSSTILTYDDYVRFKQLGLLTSKNKVECYVRDYSGHKVKAEQYTIPRLYIGNYKLINVTVVFNTNRNTNNSYRLIGLNVMKKFKTFNIDFSTKTIKGTLR